MQPGHYRNHGCNTHDIQQDFAGGIYNVQAGWRLAKCPQERPSMVNGAVSTRKCTPRNLVS
jgi:hypothetical protein